MSEKNGMKICLNLGKKCKGFTYNLGPNTVTLKMGVLDKPKFTLGVITVLKTEHKEILDFEEETCAPRMVSDLQSLQTESVGTLVLISDKYPPPPAPFYNVVFS
jgi:hypothetical protein